MARSIAEIKNQMLAEKLTLTALNGLNSPSQTAFWNLMLYLPAFAINIFEQILDLYKSAQTLLANQSVAVTIPYIYRRTLVFQYDATVVQNLVLNTTTLTIDYPNIIPAYQIITRCAVISNGGGIVTIKALKNEPPEALSNLEKDALTQYWNPVNANALGCAGVNYNILSVDPDQLEVVATVYFDGQYSAVISASVIDALNLYLKNIVFSGQVTVNGIEDAMQAVNGVLNVRLSKVQIRRDSQAFGAGIVLYDLANNINIVKINSYSGCTIEETTAAHNFVDTLTFIPQ